MTLHRLHRSLAVLLALFVILHLGNHLAGLAGQEIHRSVQTLLRGLYRHPLVEPLLLGAVGSQVVLGLALLVRRRRVTWQTVSGAGLAVFLMIHVGAVLSARWQGTETDLAFAAAGLHAPRGWWLFFAPYYGCAVLALAVHLSVPLSRVSPMAGRSLVLGGAVLALTILALLAGWIVPLTIPPDLISAFAGF
jgi:hypothetical protein